MEIDPSKGYMTLVDNGDGTVTQTINIPSAEINEVTMVIEMDFDTYIAAAFMVVNESDTLGEAFSQEVVSKATMIPDAPEEE